MTFQVQANGLRQTMQYRSYQGAPESLLKLLGTHGKLYDRRDQKYVSTGKHAALRHINNHVNWLGTERLIGHLSLAVSHKSDYIRGDQP